MWPLTAIHSRRRSTRNWRAQSKMPGSCLMVAAASAIRTMRSPSESPSHHHLKRWLDWTWRACGLATQVTGPQTNGLLPTGRNIKASWFWRGYYCPYRAGSANGWTNLTHSIVYRVPIILCRSQHRAMFIEHRKVLRMCMLKSVLVSIIDQLCMWISKFVVSYTYLLSYSMEQGPSWEVS